MSGGASHLLARAGRNGQALLCGGVLIGLVALIPAAMRTLGLHRTNHRASRNRVAPARPSAVRFSGDFR